MIVVDDESSDATAAEARAAATERVQVLNGRPVPAGWVGKSWACQQGFERARGEWLLFTDADVRHAPDTVGRALALVQRLGAEGLTLLPVLETDGMVERTVQPAAAVLIRSFVAPGPFVRSPRTPVAIAAGGFILVSRAAYEAVGGHDAMRHELVDDQMLAVRLKAAGTPLLLASSEAGCGCACTSARGRRSAAGARTPRPGWARGRSPRLSPGGGRHRLGRRAHGRARSWPSLGGPRRGGAAARGAGVVGRGQPDTPASLAPLPGRRTRPLAASPWSAPPIGYAAVSSWRGRRYARADHG